MYVHVHVRTCTCIEAIAANSNDYMQQVMFKVNNRVTTL